MNATHTYKTVELPQVTLFILIYTSIPMDADTGESNQSHTNELGANFEEEIVQADSNSLSKHSLNSLHNPIRNQEFGAFSDNDSDFQFAQCVQDDNCLSIAKEASPNQQFPTFQQIEQAVNIISAQFAHLSVESIVQKLYDCMNDGNLQTFVQIQQIKTQKNEINNQNHHKNSNPLSNEYLFNQSIDLISIISENDQKDNINQGHPYIQSITKHRDQLLNDYIKSRERENKHRERMREIQKQRSRRLEQKYNGDIVKVYPSKISGLLTDEDKDRYKQKRYAAKAFIRKGYGLACLRRELIESNTTFIFDQSRYKTISYSIATETFRKIQQFLEENCKTYISAMQKIEMRPAVSVMLHCKETFPDEAPIYIKFMQLQYGIDGEYFVISRKEAIKLYQKILSCYRIKILELRNPKYDIKRDREIDREKFRAIKIKPMYEREEPIGQDGWTNQMDCQLLEFYRKERVIVNVRDKYREKYGAFSSFEDCKLIKSRLFKVLRQAIRKLKSVVNDTRELMSYLPFLSSLNNDRIKKILISPDAMEARAGLCDFFLSHHVSATLMTKTMDLLQQALIKHDRRRGECRDRAQLDDYSL